MDVQDRMILCTKDNGRIYECDTLRHDNERLRAEVAALKAPVGMEPVLCVSSNSLSNLRSADVWIKAWTPPVTSEEDVPLYSAAQLAQVQRERGAYKKDAERWRWMRVKVFGKQPWSDADEPTTPEELHAAIDAAMQKEKE